MSNGKDNRAQQADRVTSGLLVRKFINNWALKLAKWMQEKSNKVSMKIRLQLLILSTITAIGYSLSLFKSDSGNKLKDSGVKNLATPIIIKDPKEKLDSIIASAAYDRVHHLRLFMDSLARSPGGSQKFQNIIRTRPGMMDSLLQIEFSLKQQIK
jgi:hypothetical protein